MAASSIDLQRFQAASAELNRLADATQDEGVKALTAQLIDLIEPRPGQGGTLTAQAVEQLESAAAQQGQSVATAFADLLGKALEGTIDVGGRSGPLLVVDAAAQSILAALAGKSGEAAQTVRGGLEATAESERPAGDTRLVETFLQLDDLRREGLGGTARGGRGARKKEDITALREGLSDSVLTETLETLAPQLNETFMTVGTALWKNDALKKSVAKVAADPTTARKLIPGIASQTAETMSTALGVKVVNDEVVKKGLQLLPSVGKKLGIEGVEACAENIGKVLLKEGSEEAIKAGTKQGVKKGVMGLLSTIPLANVIPMLFTGGEMLHEFTQQPPDKRVLGKGLATFALQLGALAFPPLGLAATAVDMGGSVAIAVADGQAEGLSKEDRAEKAADALQKSAERNQDLDQAVASNAGVISSVLDSIGGSLDKLGSEERADAARALAEKVKALDPEDHEAAAQLQHELGEMAFSTILPELIDQVKGQKKLGGEDEDHWALMLDGLSQVSASVIGIRKDESGHTDPERNESKLSMLIGGIIKAGAAGGGLMGETKNPAQVIDDA